MHPYFRVSLVSILGIVAAAGFFSHTASAVDVPDFAGRAAASAPAGEQVAVFAGGCFWGVDAVFKHIKGVRTVSSGYSGGDKPSPSYEAVSSGRTGHAEAVRIVYDPAKITYAQLLKVFFSVAHDPTELNRQGPDTGTQYRSAIFYTNEEQKQIAQAYIDQLNKGKVFADPIVTQVSALKQYYPAEDYHQNYLALHPNQPYIVMNDLPKLAQLKKQFPAIYQ